MHVNHCHQFVVTIVFIIHMRYVCMCCLVHTAPHALIINPRGLVVQTRGAHTSARRFIALTRLRTFGAGAERHHRHRRHHRQIAGNLETSKRRALCTRRLFVVPSCGYPNGVRKLGRVVYCRLVAKQNLARTVPGSDV